MALHVRHLHHYSSFLAIFPRTVSGVVLGAGTGGNGTLEVDNSGFSSSAGMIVGGGANSFGSITVSNNGSVYANGALELGAGLGSEGHVVVQSGGSLGAQDDASGDGLRIGAGIGSVSIDGGTLRTANTGLTTSVPIAISNEVTFNTGGRTMNIHGVISGSGSLNIIADQVILSADNTYTGGTTVTSGFLRIGAGGTTGSVMGNITNNHYVVFDRSDDYTYHGVISGTGNLWQEGHVLRLTAAQTYTGQTRVVGGILVLPTTMDQALSASTSVYLYSGATLDISNRKLTVAGLGGGRQCL